MYSDVKTGYHCSFVREKRTLTYRMKCKGTCSRNSTALNDLCMRIVCADGKFNMEATNNSDEEIARHHRSVIQPESQQKKENREERTNSLYLSSLLPATRLHRRVALIVLRNGALPTVPRALAVPCTRVSEEEARVEEVHCEGRERDHRAVEHVCRRRDPLNSGAYKQEKSWTD